MVCSPFHDVMPDLPIGSPYSGEENVQAIHGQEEINDSGFESGEHDTMSLDRLSPP